MQHQSNGEYPVVAIWPAPSDDCRSVLVVLSGNDNGIDYQHSGQKVVVVTWSSNHESNPSWLSALILTLMSALMGKYVAYSFQLVAFSRGVQAFLTCVADSQNFVWL